MTEGVMNGHAPNGQTPPAAPTEPHSELQRGVIGVLLGVMIGAIALVFRRKNRD